MSCLLCSTCPYGRNVSALRGWSLTLVVSSMAEPSFLVQGTYAFSGYHRVDQTVKASAATLEADGDRGIGIYDKGEWRAPGQAGVREAHPAVAPRVRLVAPT